MPPRQFRHVGPQLLDLIHYNPAGNNSYSTTSTTFEAIDSTNLRLAFTPTTSRVLVRARINGRNTSGTMRLTLIDVDASAAIDGAGQVAVSTESSHAVRNYVTVVSVTPGEECTWDLAWLASAGTSETLYGNGSANYGPVTVEVWSVPEDV